MYIPEAFLLEDREAVFELIRRHDFALLATARGGAVQASHLPVLLDADRGPQGTLYAHVARANPQWRDFAALESDAMVVFQGPHAYISPTWYGPGRQVPTWNYVAVHAYGRPRVIEDDAAVHALLERLVARHEAGRSPAWSMDSQEESYLSAMRRGIVAFELPIARLEAKAKLSQNKRAPVRADVAAALEAAGDPAGRAVAAAMRSLEATEFA